LTYTMRYRIVYLMKVTALIPDELINEVKALARGKNTTDAMIIAMSEWVSAKRLQALNEKIKKSPLEFTSDYSAAKVRELNRRNG
jgi:hypothetical protein